MSDISRLLAEQHIRESDMRLQHVDELLVYAEKELARSSREAETRELLARIKEERDKLAGWLEENRRRPLETWRKDELMRSGPMRIWDAIAQQIEKLVERIER